MAEGRFVSHELRVPDVEAGARFYGELFGWTATDTRVGKVFHAGQTVVGGVSAVKADIPSHWSGFVAVTDVPATVKIAKASGGIVTTDDGEPVNIPGQGWLAPILDPNRVIFIVTERRHLPAGPVPGTFIWNRLYTTDPAASLAFYQKVLPWTPILGADGVSGGFRVDDGTTVADMVPASEGTPSRWLSYVLVDDLDNARARATRLGATVVVEREQIPPNNGQSCVIADPQGAELALHQGP